MKLLIALLPALFFLSLISSAMDPAPKIGADRSIGGFQVGLQAYTFNRFTVLEAIERTAQAGGKVIEFYPGQRLHADQPDVRWDHRATVEQIALVERHLEKYGIVAVSYGVVAIPADEAEAREIFAFAQGLRLPGIATNSVESVDLIERLAREFDLQVAFHNHPRRDDRTEYRLWDPVFLAELLQGRDRRLGACADTGHWLRSGIDPVSALRILEGRVISLHLKDRADPASHDVVLGTGMGNLPGLLEELRKQNFMGPILIEYEHNWLDSIPDVAASVGFIRGYGAAKGWQ